MIIISFYYEFAEKAHPLVNIDSINYRWGVKISRGFPYDLTHPRRGIII
jgi:hypothetical protein